MDSALDLLTKAGRVFIACYVILAEASEINFATGERICDKDVVFTEGYVLSNEMLKTVARRSSADELTVMSGTTRGVLTKAPFEIDLKTVIVIHGQPHAVKRVSQYSGYKLVLIEHLTNQKVFQPEVEVFNCADNIKCFLDKLCLDLKRHYANVIPEELVVLPIAGFTYQDSLRYLYPSNQFAILAQDVAAYKEVGRRSGYLLQDDTYLKAVDLQATVNTLDAKPYIDAFNTSMGRL